MKAGPVRVTLLLTTPGWRGSGTSFVKIASGLAQRGHDVQVIAGDTAVAERLDRSGVTVHHVPTGDTGVREVGAVRRILRAQRTEVVLADAPRDVRIARYASLPRGRPIAWRYNLAHRDVPPDPLQRWLFGGLAAVVQQAEFGATRLREGMPWLRVRHHRTIANGFDLERLAPDRDAGRRWRETAGLTDAEPLVLTAGALIEGKAPLVALRALAGSGATWAAAGTGPQQELLIEEARRLGVPVRIMGQLDPEELHDAMRAATVVLQPSPVELFPNVVAEAMALGCAVVATDGGATPEVVDRAGLLFPAGDATAAAACVGELLASAERRAALGEAARSRIAAHYPLAAMEEGFDALVRELAG